MVRSPNSRRAASPSGSHSITMVSQRRCWVPSWRETITGVSPLAPVPWAPSLSSPGGQPSSAQRQTSSSKVNSESIVGVGTALRRRADVALAFGLLHLVEVVVGLLEDLTGAVLRDRVERLLVVAPLHVAVLRGEFRAGLERA